MVKSSLVRSVNRVRVLSGAKKENKMKVSIKAEGNDEKGG